MPCHAWCGLVAGGWSPNVAIRVMVRRMSSQTRCRLRDTLSSGFGILSPSASINKKARCEQRLILWRYQNPLVHLSRQITMGGSRRVRDFLVSRT
jgi:hypothetical protein